MDWKIRTKCALLSLPSHTEVAVILSQSDTDQKPSSGHFRCQRIALAGRQLENDLRMTSTPKSLNVRSINWIEIR